MKYGGTKKPWYKRLAHWQRDRSRAIRFKAQTAGGGLISTRGVGRKELSTLYKEDASVAQEVQERRSFLLSDEFDTLVGKAVAFDPAIRLPSRKLPTYMAPWHDATYFNLRPALVDLPKGNFDAVILVPFGKLGGADRVAGILAQALKTDQSVLILRTDNSDWERTDWYPEDIPAIDVSSHLTDLREAPRALYSILQVINPKSIYNVNSRLGFECFDQFGSQLSYQFSLYAYYFCSEFTPEGQEVGYPVWYAANVIPHLNAALVDSQNLGQTLVTRYSIPPKYAQHICPLYTPAVSTQPDQAVVHDQLASRRDRERPLILWAGRFDRQKRFDLVLNIADKMPDVEFMAWGKAVLEKNSLPKKLPRNLTVLEPFENYDELPLRTCDGWLYTSAWDGLPTILIELATQGMPIVASAVGGVPELIDTQTGWPVTQWDDPQAYVDALRDMLDNPQTRETRASELQIRACKRHSQERYAAQLRSLPRGTISG